MAIRYRCKRCGHVLYEFRGVGQNYIGIPTPDEIIKLVGYVCPSCKRILEPPSRNFKEYVIIRSSVETRIPTLVKPINQDTVEKLKVH